MSPKTDTGERAAIISLPALELRDRIASGELTALRVSEAFIEQIALHEDKVKAFAWFDPNFLRFQAKEADLFRAAGRVIGPLHGLPVALKDIIDTAKIPTENGAELDRGRIPTKDAVVVKRLRQSGALILGKTVTTELAFLTPSKTTNPHNAAHTPGGSSSGSAAAVAALMAPLAIGTQTGGSVIRPASYCGVVGFKPSFGAIPRTGILNQSHSLDTVGVFAKTTQGAALLAQVLFGHDKDDAQSVVQPLPNLVQMAQLGPAALPTFAFLKPFGWLDADPILHEAFAQLTSDLGAQCFEFELPVDIYKGLSLREVINYAEMACAYFKYSQESHLLGYETQEALTKGSTILARDYLTALDWGKALRAELKAIFDRADVILSPAATGPAPLGHGSTGSAIFNGLWTLIGTPAITLPLLGTRDGLPMGVQLIGPRHLDGRLLCAANWLTQWANDQINSGSQN
ncbi:MAG: amidase [Paracoccaceae bacterium]